MSINIHHAALLADERRRDAERAARTHAHLARLAGGPSRRPVRRVVAIGLAAVSRASATIARRLDATSAERVGRRPPSRVGARR